MKNFKKVIAAISAISLLVLNASFFTANAANISSITVNGGTTLAASTTVTTVSFTPTTTLTDGSSFKVFYPSTMNDTSLIAGNITVTNAVPDMTPGTIVVDITNDSITVPVTTAGTSTSIVTLTFAGGTFVGPTSGNISFSIITTDGDTGAQLVYVANSNEVNISATVEPILKMAFANTALDLGVLATTANSYTAQTIAITTATNAKSGLTVTMTSAGLKDTTLNREIGINSIDAAIDTTAIDYYKVQSNATSNAAVLVDTNGADQYAAAGTDMLATQTVVPNSGVYAVPHNNIVTTVSIAARADTLTDAGNYTDTLVFSVTGTY